MAVQLHHEGHPCELVVAAVERCSRPDQLRPFLYLDFIDRNKYENVWDKLLQTISERPVTCTHEGSQKSYVMCTIHVHVHVHVHVLFRHCMYPYTALGLTSESVHSVAHSIVQIHVL